MRPPFRLVALPVGLALILTATGCSSVAGAGPTPSSAPSRSAAPRFTPAADDVCKGVAAGAVAAARSGSAPYATLGGSTFTDRASSAGPAALGLDAATYTLSDFAAGQERIDAARVPAGSGGVVGAGSDRTRITLQAHSSSRRSVVPGREYEINPLNLIRISAAHAVVGGLTVTGTAQGHTYNGLRIERSKDARVADVHVVGIPGDMDRPPGETFGINDYKTVGSRYEHVDVDGAGVGAAGFGVNASQDITVCASSSHDNPVSMGFAFWTARNITLIDCRAQRNGFSGFNFERVSGTVTLIRPVASDNRWDMRVVSDLGSAKYTIVDPDLSRTQVPGKWTVAIPSTYWKHPGKQRRSDIRLIVHGKSRPDLLRFVQPY